MLKPQVMIVAQPTWGVDVGAAQLIWQALIDLRKQGVALLVISEEIDELFAISDRICVLADGRLSPQVALADTNIEQIGNWMSGNFAALPSGSAPAMLPTSPQSASNRRTILLKLERRPAPSKVMRIVSPLIAALAMLLTGIVFFTVLGKDPQQAFYVFFIKPLQTTYGFGELLLKATPLLLCAIGSVSRFRCECLEYRCRGPTDGWRHCRRRRGAMAGR